jgi:hypothetical protein
MKASCLWKFWVVKGALVCASAHQSLPIGFQSANSLCIPTSLVQVASITRGDTLLRMRGGAEFNPYDPATYYESCDNAGNGGTTYEQLGAPGTTYEQLGAPNWRDNVRAVGGTVCAQAAESNQQDSERKQELIRQFREAVSEFFWVLWCCLDTDVPSLPSP